VEYEPLAAFCRSAPEIPMSRTHAEEPLEFPWAPPAPGAPPVELRPGIHWVRQSLPLQLFLDTLDRLGALPEDVLVLPSHGAPFIGLHACLDRLRRHHARRLRQTVEACAE
jgi:glyoxylase-like metal-dependent hydrolase (beta-lactamase superfamily II)